MDKLEQHIMKMQGVFDCLLMQGRINNNLHKFLEAGLSLIHQTSQVYAKPKSKASFSEVEEYVNRHINMADMEVLEAELERRKEVANSL